MNRNEGAGFISHRTALLQAQQLQQHLGFSILSPSSPISPSSPLRHYINSPTRPDPNFVAEQMMSTRHARIRGAKDKSEWRDNEVAEVMREDEQERQGGVLRPFESRTGGGADPRDDGAGSRALQFGW